MPRGTSRCRLRPTRSASSPRPRPRWTRQETAGWRAAPPGVPFVVAGGGTRIDPHRCQHLDRDGPSGARSTGPDASRASARQASSAPSCQVMAAAMRRPPTDHGPAVPTMGPPHARRREREPVPPCRGGQPGADRRGPGSGGEHGRNGRGQHEHEDQAHQHDHRRYRSPDPGRGDHGASGGATARAAGAHGAQAWPAWRR